jgi:hypothetical protein
VLRLTRDEQAEIAQAARTLLVKPGVDVTFNGSRSAARARVRVRDHAGHGDRRRGRAAPADARKTTVRVYEPLPGQPARLYELSVPVVETGDTWDVQVMQRVPLNMERDNVTPGYLRDLRADVLSAMSQTERFTAEVAAAAWVTDGAGSPRSTDQAVHSVMDLRYGTERVGADPSDRQAEKEAVAHGHAVVQQLALPPELRQRVKEAGALAPAGRVFPPPKPFDKDADKPLRLLPKEEWTRDMLRMASMICLIADIVFEDPVPQRLSDHLVVDIADDPGWKLNGCYRGAPFRHTINAAALGRDWFGRFILDPSVMRFVLHELAHEKGHHLDHAYHEALCLYGARLALAVHRRPNLFKGMEPEAVESRTP